MALPVEKNITIYKGDTFTLQVRLRERNTSGGPGSYVNLTGCTAKAQVRATEDAASVLAEFNVTVPDQSVTANHGKILLTLTPAQTGASTFTGGKWDVQVTFPDTSVRTYVRGSVLVTKEITRD